MNKVLPLVMAVCFFIIYFEIIDKLLVFFDIKQHYRYEYTKVGLHKSVLNFVGTFHKLSEELLAYDHIKNAPVGFLLII